MSAAVDETGKRYGRLVVTARAVTKDRSAQWLCQCECGNTTIVSGGNLRKKTTTSCGCLSRNRAARLRKLNALDLFDEDIL